MMTSLLPLCSQLTLRSPASQIRKYFDGRTSGLTSCVSIKRRLEAQIQADHHPSRFLRRAFLKIFVLMVHKIIQSHFRFTRHPHSPTQP